MQGPVVNQSSLGLLVQVFTTFPVQADARAEFVTRDGLRTGTDSWIWSLSPCDPFEAAYRSMSESFGLVAYRSVVCCAIFMIFLTAHLVLS